MANLKFKYVLIDVKTRRPAQLPENHRNLIQSRMANRKGPAPEITYKVQHPPSDAYKCEFTVQSSDTDLNRHTNNTTYIRFCYDAVAKAFRENKLPWMKGGLWDYRVLRMNIYYAQESKEGDKLIVYMWSNNEVQELLHFVFRIGNMDIFHSTVEFKHKSALVAARL